METKLAPIIRTVPPDPPQIVKAVFTPNGIPGSPTFGYFVYKCFDGQRILIGHFFDKPTNRNVRNFLKKVAPDVPFDTIYIEPIKA